MSESKRISKQWNRTTKETKRISEEAIDGNADAGIIERETKESYKEVEEISGFGSPALHEESVSEQQSVFVLIRRLFLGAVRVLTRIVFLDQLL
ncbi:MAG: hypothetical protein OXH77_04155 [Anaerolineaceae bacterium]|nr:hypothetical protein [Anaerolineaceae bacterium]